MKQLVLASAMALGLLAAGTPAQAQAPLSPYSPYYSPYSRQPGIFPGGGPQLSPFLDLRRGGNPAANYFLGTVPEIDRRRYQNESRSQIRGLQERVYGPALLGEDVDLEAPRSITGHPAVFGYTGSYFNTGTSGRSPAITPARNPATTGAHGGAPRPR